MMLQYPNEDRIDFADAAAFLNQMRLREKPVTTGEIRRWARDGQKLPGRDHRVYLEHQRIAGRLYTTCGGVLKYLNSINDADREYFERRAATKLNR